MQKIVKFRNSRGLDLVGRFSSVNNSIADDFCILILTGYPSSKDHKKYGDLQKKFDELNLSSFCFDYSGLGESQGRFEDLNVTQALDDTNSALTYLKTEGFHSFGLLGVSFGGGVAIQTAYQNDTIQKLCLVCPVIDFLDQKLVTKTKSDFREWKEKGYVINTDRFKIKRKVPYSFFEDLAQYQGYFPLYELDKRIPILIIHGQEDDRIPFDLSLKAQKICSNLKIEKVAEADHQFENSISYKQMIESVKQFFNS